MVTNIVFDETVLQDFPLDVSFNVSYFENRSKKRFFIMHIVFTQPMVLKNVPYIFSAQEKIMEMLMNDSEVKGKENCTVMAIFEFKESVNIFPDINIYRMAEKSRDFLEQKYKISLRGVVVILKLHRIKLFNWIAESSRIFSRSTNMALVTSYGQAIKQIEKFIKYSNKTQEGYQ